MLAFRCIALQGYYTAIEARLSSKAFIGFNCFLQKAHYKGKSDLFRRFFYQKAQRRRIKNLSKSFKSGSISIIFTAEKRDKRGYAELHI
jgi:hypothetical protein